MKIRSTSRPNASEERRNPANAQSGAQLKQATAATMPDARASSIAHLRHQERASNSSQAAKLKVCADLMAIRGADAPVQRVEDEELLQGKFATVQREEDEELLQGKLAPVRRMDEGEPLQGKFDALQRKEAGKPPQIQIEQTFASVASAKAPIQPTATAADERSTVVQRALFNHGREALETTDHHIQGDDQKAGLHDILADMCSAGATEDIESLKKALLEDLESESEGTVEWVGENVGIGTLLEQISTVLSALAEKSNQESTSEGSAEEASDEEGQDVGGQTVGKLTFAGDTYHQVVKPAVISTIGVKKLSILVYRDKKHHNFNFWFERNGQIYADVNSNRNSKGKDTGYRWDGNAVVEN